ncbi:MAG: hypothetical protein mread185_000597 [Mycoplasmataceae bacterium]|nr:MAG: hypothetical protein mread185_000597 [Mycoplasmataceae bacterium]
MQLEIITVELFEQIEEIKKNREVQISELNEICLATKTDLEEALQTIDIINKNLESKGIILSPTEEKPFWLSEELEKLGEFSKKIMSRSSSITELKDKMSSSTLSSISRASSRSHSLRKKNDEKNQRISILTEGIFSSSLTASPACLSSPERQEEYFGQQNQDLNGERVNDLSDSWLTNSNNLTPDSKAKIKEINDISYDDYQSLKKQLKIAKKKLSKMEEEREKYGKQKVEFEEQVETWRKKSSDFSFMLSSVKKQIKDLEKKALPKENLTEAKKLVNSHLLVLQKKAKKYQKKLLQTNLTSEKKLKYQFKERLFENKIEEAKKFLPKLEKF